MGSLSIWIRESCRACRIRPASTVSRSRPHTPRRRVHFDRIYDSRRHGHHAQPADHHSDALPSTANSGTAVPANWYTAVATGGYPCVTSATINAVNCPRERHDALLQLELLQWHERRRPEHQSDHRRDHGNTDLGWGADLGHPGDRWSGAERDSWTANVTIGGAANFTIVTGTLPAGTVGTPYTPTVTSQGGLTPMTWTRVSGNLPPGVNDCTPSNISCTFSGTPTVAGTYNFSLQASYNNGSAVDSNIQAYTVVIAQSGSTLALPAPTPQSVALNQAVTMNFVASGGTTPYTFATTPLFGSFPPGLTSELRGRSVRGRDDCGYL